MKLTQLALITGFAVFVFPFSAGAETSLSDIEARLNSLEKRAAEAEARAVAAEKKAERLESLMAQNTAPAGNTDKGNTSGFSNIVSADNGKGSLKLYGDVEFNIDAASRKGQITSMHTQTGHGADDFGDKERWDINGRILIGLDGQRKLDNGNYAGFSVQPLANMTGNIGLDDAVFYFGKENKWKYKIGRYEAYDMFPLNQDTFVEHSGNSANDLYADGFGYIYMMKEGRGRSNHGGGMNLSSQYDNWYFEVNTLVEDGSRVFKDQEYHGRKLQNKKNVIYVRPVVAWNYDNVTIAGAVDANVISNAYGFDNADGKFTDQSRRTGYGLTMKWDTLKDDPENGVVVNLSTAYLDAKNENDFSAGTNILWRKFQLGYIYAHNDIKSYQVVNALDDSQYDTLNPGRYNIHTVFTSYELPDILGMDNFKTYLGAYYSHINGKGDMTMVDSKDNDRYGARVRFKYLF
ncbi:carbohydrate porin [Morganella sp. GD04133]|uniref:carbohydrate porin n=1 Tax=Morganella sp. GD04133 TaxID=2975435 RepID=UPI00244CD122|nr:carbohydrate porin [Morganella sp. GD04133]MDH0357077.1 carbohydrate porin [Morganella sp. GD04133]